MKNIKILSFFLGALGLGWFSFNYMPRAVAEMSIIEKNVVQTQSTAPTTDQPALLKKLTALFVGGTVSISAQNLKTHEYIGLAPDTAMDGASTTKLIIATYAYHLAETGKVNLDSEAVIHASDIQKYGSGSIQYQKPPYHYTYRQLIKLMLNISDNTAAYVLTERLGRAELNMYADSAMGLQHTKKVDNMTTADDMRRVIESVYMSTDMNKTDSRDMMSYMIGTDSEDRIAAGLPDTATVYHKTGEGMQGEIHDVGIVTDKGITYSVAIFTQDFSRERVVTQDIVSASRLLYDYFASHNTSL